MWAWAICNDRNNSVHNRPIPTTTNRCEWINEYLAEYKQANSIGRVHVQSEKDIINIISKGEEFILHTDAAFMGSQRTSGIGLVIRDKSGNLKAAQTLCSPVCSSPLGAEAVAVLEGLRLAKSLDVHHLSVLSNSLSLIQSINGDIHCDSRIATTV